MTVARASYGRRNVIRMPSGRASSDNGAIYRRCVRCVGGPGRSADRCRCRYAVGWRQDGPRWRPPVAGVTRSAIAESGGDRDGRRPLLPIGHRIDRRAGRVHVEGPPNSSLKTATTCRLMPYLRVILFAADGRTRFRCYSADTVCCPNTNTANRSTTTLV